MWTRDPYLPLSHPKAASSLFEPIPWHIHTLNPHYNLPWRCLRQQPCLRAFAPPPPRSSTSSLPWQTRYVPIMCPLRPTRAGPDHVRAKCASRCLPASCVFVSALPRDLGKGCQRTWSAAETHVDRPCGKETPLTFVYISADAVRSDEGLLKPHCRYMRMSVVSRRGYFQYSLCLLFSPSSFFCFKNHSHVWSNLKHWDYFCCKPWLHSTI